MNHNLTDDEKHLLRFIISGITAGNLKKEFILVWGADGPVVGFKENEGFLSFPDMSKSKLASLADEGLIRRLDQGEHAELISITQKGYDAAASNFKETKKADKEWIKIWLQLAALIVSVGAALYAVYLLRK